MTHLGRETIREAVARGWCHPDNEKKEMDARLAEAIVDEIILLLEGVDDCKTLGGPR
jgi:hypothetical protein